MASRTFQMIDVVEILQHWHAGRPKLVLASSLGVDMKKNGLARSGIAIAVLTVAALVYHRRQRARLVPDCG